jgi:hypothetical protein
VCGGFVTDRGEMVDFKGLSDDDSVDRSLVVASRLISVRLGVVTCLELPGSAARKHFALALDISVSGIILDRRVAFARNLLRLAGIDPL